MSGIRTPSVSDTSSPSGAPGASGVPEFAEFPVASDKPRTPVDQGGWDSRSESPLPLAAPGAGALSAAAPVATAAVRRGPAAPSLGAGPARRGPADPVRALMHRHRELCERAVDPLEIAAGLEAHGVTDRTAARFRHRDVFALAEELYARVPRAGDGDDPGHDGDGAASAATATPAHGSSPRAGWIAHTLLPGAACALTVTGLGLTTGEARLAVGAAGVLVVALALSRCLRHGPLRAEGRPPPAARLWVLWLLGYALLGDGLLEQLVSGGPEGPWPLATAPLVGLAAALAPAAWCAHLLAVQARRKLTTSRGTEEFAAAARPLLLGVTVLFVCALVGLQLLAGAALGDVDRAAVLPAVALGTLLFLATLLTVHGFPEPASTGLAVATGVQMTALAAVLAARLPGCGFIARPVEAAVQAGGAGTVPTVACAVAALGLLVHATAALSRASAHAARHD
ncbi:hypothetical protein [Streptomyces sp. H27-C3]|uniref:hypothetical protein n=1 Tax=Streptomyces sp. H27-C3 TaxID=3046305 RepID=UPI0024BB4412|nr:hypothetical protein [Streptomyces sp. H27-C3]MDJ0465453.1 hypothetical protein [Streptomyces sp. H27-C3]